MNRSVADFRKKAQARLPRFLFDYADGGAIDETTLNNNISDLRRIELRQKVLRDVSKIDVSTTLFDRRCDLPVFCSPVGLAGMYARRGETQAVKAANQANIPFTLSTVSACSIEEVEAAASEPFWFQLYMVKDRGFMRDLLQRARTAKCSALIFTVDMSVPGIRYRDYRSGLAGADNLAGSIRRFCQGMMKPHWAWNVGVRGRPHTLGNFSSLLGDKSGMEDFFAWLNANFDPSITWQDLAFVREEWPGPLIVKGVLEPGDAEEAAAIGADAVIVSNHGGRQLDGAQSSVMALPKIVEAVGQSIKVFVDGGVRSGTDVLRMLALGADAVGLGRAWVWALASDGERGVQALMQTIENELRIAMALTSATSIEEINRELLVGFEKS